MRIIETDNFGGDYPNEKWACPYVFDAKGARKVAELFNQLMSGHTAPRYWRAVEDDYELRSGLEP